MILLRSSRYVWCDFQRYKIYADEIPIERNIYWWCWQAAAVAAVVVAVVCVCNGCLGPSITNNSKWRGRSQTPRYLVSIPLVFLWLQNVDGKAGWRLRLALFILISLGSKLRASAWYIKIEREKDTLIYMAFTRFNSSNDKSTVCFHTNCCCRYSLILYRKFIYEWNGIQSTHNCHCCCHRFDFLLCHKFFPCKMVLYKTWRLIAHTHPHKRIKR